MLCAFLLLLSSLLLLLFARFSSPSNRNELKQKHPAFAFACRSMRDSVLANMDKMECFGVNCCFSEALEFSGSDRPLFADGDLWSAGEEAVLLSEGNFEQEGELSLKPPGELDVEDVVKMTSEEKAQYLLVYDEDGFEAENLPRPRFLKTREGETFVHERLLSMLRATVERKVREEMSSGGFRFVFNNRKSRDVFRQRNISEESDPSYKSAAREEAERLEVFKRRMIEYMQVEQAVQEEERNRRKPDADVLKACMDATGEVSFLPRASCREE